MKVQLLVWDWMTALAVKRRGGAKIFMAVSLELAISAIRAGRKEEGRQLLNLLIQRNPNDDKAWLWMSSVVDTDEQRARCLYHVLAINPDSDIARRGLQILGIVVSDSRPVKVPRDSQPIKIPKPSPEDPSRPFLADSLSAAPAAPRPRPASTQTPVSPGDTPTPQPNAPSDSQPVAVNERRPFRIDPKAIVDELPFKPITEPFSAISKDGEVSSQREQPEESSPKEAGQANQTPPQPQPQSGPVSQDSAVTHSMPSPFSPAPINQAQPQPGQGQHPSEPVAAVQPGPGNQSQPQSAPSGPPSEPSPVSQPQGQEGPQQHPSEPVPVVPSQNGPGQMAQQPPHQQAGASFNSPPQPQNSTQQMMPAPQAPYPFSPPPHDTRPSQPVPVAPSDPTMGMPMQGQYGAAQPQPSGPGPAIHSNMTMGMPTQNYQPQSPSQPMPGIHSNSTLGMPTQEQSSGQMPVMQQPQYQQPMPQNAAVHSSSTMAMPMGQDPFAALRASANQSNQSSQTYQNGSKGNGPDENDEEEINLLAVIIFGSLSITALGGLGMLILLMFTTG